MILQNEGIISYFVNTMQSQKDNQIFCLTAPSLRMSADELPTRPADSFNNHTSWGVLEVHPSVARERQFVIQSSQMLQPSSFSQSSVAHVMPSVPYPP